MFNLLDLERTLQRAIEENVFPGAVIVFGNKKSKTSVSAGNITYYGNKDYRYLSPAGTNVRYDIASLTKPIIATAIFILISQKKLNLDSKINDLLRTDNFSGVTIRQVLGHASGLRLSFSKIKKKSRKVIENKIRNTMPVTPPGKHVYYTGQGYYLLGKAIEKISGQTLDEFLIENIFRPLVMDETNFYPFLEVAHAPRNPTIVAPTEKCDWRKITLCGQPHDEVAYKLETPCGHAGLFSTAEDMFKFGLFWLSIKDQKIPLDEIIIDNFPEAKNDTGSDRIFGLGWRLCDRKSNGKFISGKTISMVGFTGPSLMIDLEKELVVVIMNNHIHPRRKNEAERKLKSHYHASITEKIYKINFK